LWPLAPIVTVPGITSYHAAAAASNRPLVEGEESLLIMSGIHGGERFERLSDKPDNPVEFLSLVVLSFAAEFTSGFAAAGALLQQGVLNTKQAVLALLIGNVVAFPIRALRHQLQRLMGIFTPKLGLQILLLGQGFRITSLVLVGTTYYMIFFD
jgi:hypothetical protein